MNNVRSVFSIVLLGSALLLTGCSGNKEWRVVRDSVLPQLMEGNLKRLEPLLVHRPISRDLDIGYVIDGEVRYDFIYRKQLENWNITEKTLYKTAMKNLEKLAKKTVIQFAEAGESESGRYAIIETDDGYDAVRLLSSTIRKEMRDYIGEEYLAGVPTRNFLIVWNKDFAKGGDFLAEIEKTYKVGGKYKLTPRVFLVKEEGFEPLTKQPVPGNGE